MHWSYELFISPCSSLAIQCVQMCADKYGAVLCVHACAYTRCSHVRMRVIVFVQPVMCVCVCDVHVCV